MADYLTNLGLLINNDLRHDWDACIGISGMEGTAKSTFGIQFCRKIDPEFKITPDRIAYRYENLVEKIYSLPKYSAILADEMGLVAFNRESMVKANRDFIKALMVCRDQNKALVYCIPNFWFSDPYVRNHRTTYWIHLPQVEVKGNRLRGFAKVRKKKENEWGETPYWQFIKSIRFEKLPDHIYAVYKEQKAAAIKKLIEETAEGKKDDIKNYRKELVFRARKIGYTQKEIGKLLDCSQQTIARIEAEA
jgi:hypothetical protein